MLNASVGSKSSNYKSGPTTLPSGIQMPQKTKKRPMSAMESRNLKKVQDPSDNFFRFQAPSNYAKAGTSLSKIPGDRKAPFVAVLPTNPVRKTTKYIPNDFSGASLNSAPLNMTPMFSGGRKPSPRAVTSPPIIPAKTANTPRSIKQPLQQAPLAKPRTLKKKLEVSTQDSSAGRGTGGTEKVPLPSNQDSRYHRSNTTNGLFVPPLPVSNYAKSAALSVANVKIRGKANVKPAVKTQVVLAPRFGPDSEQSTLAIVPEEGEDNFSRIETTYGEKRENPTGANDNDSSINFSAQPMADFSPAKSQWVKMALGKLGKTWVASGVVPQYMMDFPEFQKKIGDLYDMAVDKKCNQLKLAQVGDNFTREIKSVVPMGSKNKLKDKADKAFKMDVGDTIPEDVQKKMSDIILHLLLTKLMPPNDEEIQNTEKTLLSDVDDSVVDDSTIGTQVVKARKEIINCYVLEGKICPIDKTELPHKHKHSFGSLGESRRRTDPEGSGEYFRRVADLRGFEVDEVTMRFTKTRIFVEGRQPHKGEKNARQVREIIALPKTLGIKDLKVMRGRKGLLVFEEVSKSTM